MSQYRNTVRRWWFIDILNAQLWERVAYLHSYIRTRKHISTCTHSYHGTGNSLLGTRMGETVVVWKSKSLHIPNIAPNHTHCCVTIQRIRCVCICADITTLSLNFSSFSLFWHFTHERIHSLLTLCADTISAAFVVRARKSQIRRRKNETAEKDRK